MEAPTTAMPPHTAVPAAPAAPVPAFGMLPEQLLALTVGYADAPETGQAAASCHALRAAALHAMPGGYYTVRVCIDSWIQSIRSEPQTILNPPNQHHHLYSPRPARRPGGRYRARAPAARATATTRGRPPKAAAPTAPYARLRSLALAGDMAAATTTADDNGHTGPYPLTSDLLQRLAARPPLARLDLEGLRIPTPEALAALLDLMQLLGPCVDAAAAAGGQQEQEQPPPLPLSRDDGGGGGGRLVSFFMPGPGLAGPVPMDPESLGKVLR